MDLEKGNSPFKHYEVVKTDEGLEVMSFNITREDNTYHRLYIERSLSRHLIESNHPYLRHSDAIRKIDHNPTPKVAIDKFLDHNITQQEIVKRQLQILIDDYKTVRKMEIKEIEDAHH